MPLNPLDWTAEPFLALYISLAAVVFLLGFLARSMIGPPMHAPRKLSELELAFLSGGPKRIGDAILLALTSGNGAAIAPGGDRISVIDVRPLAALIKQPSRLAFQSNMTRLEFQKAVGPVIEEVRERLEALGYFPSDGQMTSFRVTALPFVLGLLGFGIIKMVLGSERHHPVGILTFLLFLTAFAGFMLTRRPMRTRAGGEVLRSYQATHARAARAPLNHELLLALALTGPVVLSGTAYASVYVASKTMSSGNGGGCGGGGDGGGGGCGGCGGGS